MKKVIATTMILLTVLSTFAVFAPKVEALDDCMHEREELKWTRKLC